MKNWTYPAPLQVVWLAVVFFMNSARALDTYEVYAPGLSDFEAYTTQSRHNFLHEAIVGYGLNDYVNPTLWLSFFGEQGGANIDETIRLMNVSTIYDGALKIDLLPMLDYSPEAKTWVAALVTEVNFPISRWEPFFYWNLQRSCAGHGSPAHLGCACRLEISLS